MTDLGTLDHLIYGAPRLDDAAHELEVGLGLRPAGGGQHPGLGTRNALLGLGRGRYLEIIAPDPDQPVPSTARPFGLDVLEGPRLVGWALRCEHIDLAIRQARERGYDPGDPVELQRTTPAGATLRWRLTLNAVEGGVVPFLIDWGGSEHPSASAPRGLDLISFHLEHPSPAEPKRMLEAMGTNVEVVEGPRPALIATIGGPLGHMAIQ